MSYKRYHFALVFILVVEKLLKGTELEEKSSFLLGDLIEYQKIAKYDVFTANQKAIKIYQSIEVDEIVAPFPKRGLKAKWEIFKDYIFEP
ncbi:hypothetical protein BI362_07510 [Streptococcus parauberis]|nr:hypothetical protein BI362_07510 [Streptococcus parauberis]